jgi:hypothetical protein
MLIWETYTKKTESLMYKTIKVYRGLFLFGFILLYASHINTETTRK